MNYNATYRNSNTAVYGENPLCDKLRAKFNFMGNRTVGEAAMLRAMTEGFNPYEDSGVQKSHSTQPPRTKQPAQAAQSARAKQPAQEAQPPHAKQPAQASQPARTNHSVQAKSMPANASACATARPVKANMPAPARSVAVSVHKPKVKECYVKHKTPFPIGTLILVIICAAMLAFVVYSGVLINQMTREISDLQKQAATLSADEEKLELSLQEKNDLRVIEQIATNQLGMVKRDQIVQKYISMSSGDKIEVFDPSGDETDGAGATLLSAVGKNFSDLMEYLD